jgi:hypothetical protein
VVRKHAFGEIRVEGRYWREHFGATTRVGDDRTSLGRREMRLLMNDVEECLVNLADVVKEGDTLDPLPLVFVELSGIG